MDRPRPRLAPRDWPLAGKVVAALTVTLLPPGIVAVVAALRTYNFAVGHRAAGVGLTPSEALSIALPLLMWLAALGIGWLVANSLIVRPLTGMRQAVEAYAAGDTGVRLGDRRFFSREVQALAGSFDALADGIALRDAAVQTALAEQKRLTREVHHRVKNNLQIVSSLLSIQSRDAANAEVAHAYALVQSRVAALATVHRWMYSSDDQSASADGVDLKALTTDLAAGLEQNLAGSEHVGVSIVTEVERLFVGQDTAVPLAFLITELVSCAARLGAPKALDARVLAGAIDGHAVLTVVASGFRGEDHFDKAGRHPSSRIVHGMARQLRSPLAWDAAAGSYSIRFPLPSVR